MSFMQSVRDGRQRRQGGIPTGFKILAVVWVTFVLSVIGALVWIAGHFLMKFW